MLRLAFIPAGSIVLSMNLEITLWMCADRADFRRFRPHNDMTAVAALPYLDFALGKDFLGFYIFQQSTVTLLMMFLDLSNHTELRCQLLEAFFLCRLSKPCVHIRPLVVFTIRSIFQVGGCIINAFKFLEPQLGMLFLVVCRFQEQRRDLLESVFFRTGSEIRVLVTGLTLAGKSC